MSFERLFADQRMGDDRAYLHDRSPVNFVQNIRVPLLNAYGYNDARVDIRQWKLLEPKLKEFKKTYEILIEDDEGHGFRNEANRIAFYKKIESFLARYLSGPNPSVRLGPTEVIETPVKEKSN